MVRLAFIRHGQSDYADPDGLTPWGRQQVEKIAQRLAAHLQGSQKVFLAFSPTGRTLQTAQVLADTLGFSRGRTIGALHPDNGDDFAQGPGRYIPDDVDTVILISHSDKIEDYVSELMGRRVFEEYVRGRPVPMLGHKRELGNAEAVIIRYRAQQWADRGEPEDFQVMRIPQTP